jgi:hypothetical protein
LVFREPFASQNRNRSRRQEQHSVQLREEGEAFANPITNVEPS